MVMQAPMSVDLNLPEDRVGPRVRRPSKRVWVGGVAIGGIFIRLVRVNMIQTLKADYVEAARARGIPERQVVLRHAFRNALVPVVTIVGLQFALLLSGAVLTETTFTWPGIGLSLYQFLQDRDYIGVQGLVTFYALFVVVVSLLIDVVSAWVDPRIRYG